jgi:four helix bundle protein
MGSNFYSNSISISISNLGWGMATFDPERMAVYRLARQHTRAVRVLLGKADLRGFSDLANQLRESTVSIPANILEAAGEWRPKKRMHYLMIAKGSTWESWAHTDSMVDFQLVSEAAIADARELQGEITGLLITTIRRLETETMKKKRRGSGVVEAKLSPTSTP